MSESTLTSPEDRSQDRKFIKQLKANCHEPPLSPRSTRVAADQLVKPIGDFKRIERRYADPTIPLQAFGLISFVPAKGATPNESGVYGFAKLRGNFASEVEAHQKSVSLIRDVDSYHTIHTCYVGRPFPITNEDKYSAEKDLIDIKKSAQEAFSKSVRDSREAEQKTVQDIKEREKRLLEETKEDFEESDIDKYTTLMVKKAQVSWTYKENKTKLAEMKNIIEKTRRELAAMDEVDPTLKENYYEKYKKARLDAGFKDDESSHQNNFMKFLVEDIDF